MTGTKLAATAALFGALCVWTINHQAQQIEADIHSKASAVANMVDTLDVVVDGRDVRLQGRIRTHASPERLRNEVADLLAAIEALTGVRQVHARIELLGPGQNPAESALMMMMATNGGASRHGAT